MKNENRRFLFGLGAICLGASLALTLTAGPRLQPPIIGVYHGAFPYFPGAEDEVSAQYVATFEALAQKKIAWVYFSNNWFSGIHFPRSAVQEIHDYGVVPFIRMMSRSGLPWESALAPPGQIKAADPVYTMQRIIDGDFDAELSAWAQEAKSMDFPLLVEFGTEVNGDWFPWNGRWNGGGSGDQYGDPAVPDGPERFRDAYRHIIGLFRDQGVDNITWVFHINSRSIPEVGWNNMKAYYPGDAYIDWIGISVYGAQFRDDEWETFTAILDQAYPELTAISPTKPLAVMEFAVAEYPQRGNKAEWIRQALQAIKSNRYPRISAISYWNDYWENEDGFISNLRIDSSPQALAAYRRGVADPFFLTEALFGTPPHLSLAVKRKTERAWIISRDYAKIDVSVEPTENPLSVSRYIIYKQEQGKTRQIWTEFSSTSFHGLDRELGKGKSYTYQVAALDVHDQVLALSSPIAI